METVIRVLSCRELPAVFHVQPDETSALQSFGVSMTQEAS
jgi:hypothetical protein